jgi:hypothetical protein
MENFGKRTILILAAGFLIVNLVFGVFLAVASHQSAVGCAYRGSSLTCPQVAG